MTLRLGYQDSSLSSPPLLVQFRCDTRITHVIDTPEAHAALNWGSTPGGGLAC